MRMPALVAAACLLTTSIGLGQTPARSRARSSPQVSPTARFTAAPVTGVAPLKVCFTDRSTGVVSGWSWDFGDTKTSTRQNPSHIYNAGTYTVSLEVTGPGGSDTETREAFITVLDSTADSLPPGFVDEPVFTSFTHTTGFQVMGEDDVVVWTKQGEVWRWVDGGFLGQPMVDITEEVANWNDHGLHGFAVDPHYDTNGFVYLYYAVDRHHLDHFGTPSYDPLADEFFRETIGRITRYAVYDPSDPATTVDPATRTVLCRRGHLFRDPDLRDITRTRAAVLRGGREPALHVR